MGESRPLQPLSPLLGTVLSETSLFPASAVREGASQLTVLEEKEGWGRVGL